MFVCIDVCVCEVWCMKYVAWLCVRACTHPPPRPSASDDSQKYKQGKFILEKTRFTSMSTSTGTGTAG